MGRVNFGSEVFDQKGIFAPVEFEPSGGVREELRGWEVSSLPLDAAGAGRVEIHARPRERTGLLARRFSRRFTRRYFSGSAQLGTRRHLGQRSLPGPVLEHRSDPNYVPARTVAEARRERNRRARPARPASSGHRRTHCTGPRRGPPGTRFFPPGPPEAQDTATARRRARRRKPASRRTCGGRKCLSRSR